MTWLSSRSHGRLRGGLVTSVLAGCPAPSPGEETATAPTTGTSEGEGESSTATSADPPTGTTDAESTTTGTTDAQATSTPSTGTTDAASTTGGTTGTSETTAATTTTDPGTTSEDATSTGQTPDMCGNGVLDPGEACDDGNVLAGDGCLPNCTLGDGVALPAIDLPPESVWTCLTTIDAAVLGEPSHVLALGGWTTSPTKSAIVQGFALPDGQASPGSFVHPGLFDRIVDQVATAADGDIVVAGHIYTDEPQTAGHLWLARVTAAGQVVWLREHEALATDPEDLALTPSGDIVLASRVAGWGGGFKPSWLQVFDPDGELVWEHPAPAGPDSQVSYKAVAVDADGTFYVAGSSQHMGDAQWRLLLAALAGDGTPQWQTETPARLHLRVAPSGIVVTEEGTLMVAAIESDSSLEFGGEPGLAAFDPAGGLLLWKTLESPQFWNTWAGRIAAAPGGGALVAWGMSQEDISRTLVARYDEDGEALWEIESDSQTGPRDAGLGPDERFYVLEGESVRPYLP
jgi:cysteine-rich repeat protein